MTQRFTLTLILLALLAASLSLKHQPAPAVAELVAPRMSEIYKNQVFPPPLPETGPQSTPAAFDI